MVLTLKYLAGLLIDIKKYLHKTGIEPVTLSLQVTHSTTEL